MRKLDVMQTTRVHRHMKSSLAQDGLVGAGIPLVPREAPHAMSPERMLVSAAIRGEEDERSRERIRRLFFSPLGVYVSHASRARDELRLEIDVATEDLDFALRTLRQVFPEAVIEEIRPRVFERRQH
jgi:hypothetical protein